MSFKLADSEKERMAYWIFSVIVLVSQFWLLVGMPMTLFLGRDLGAEVEEVSARSFPSSALNLIEVGLNLGPSEIHHTTGTMISCSFTSMFVAFIGMYLIYFLLPLPVGVFLGAVAFIVREGTTCWSPRVANMTALCILITELLSTASILGPFIIAYQILGGTTQWWLAAGLMGVCRPPFAIQYTKANKDPSSLQFCAIPVVSAYLGISMIGAVLLWESYNGALDAIVTGKAGEAVLLGRLSVFTFAIYGANVWFVSSSAYMLLCDAGCAARVGRRIERRVFREWWGQVSSWIERQLEIPCVGKLLHTRWISQETWQLQWESFFFPWLVWLLEMDALVSFLYHFVKVCYLGGSFQTF